MNNVQVVDYIIVSEEKPDVCADKVRELLKDEWVLHGPLIVTAESIGVHYVQALAKVKIHGPPPGMIMEMPPGARIIGR